jgi:hypothetical protein
MRTTVAGAADVFWNYQVVSSLEGWAAFAVNCFRGQFEAHVAQGLLVTQIGQSFFYHKRPILRVRLARLRRQLRELFPAELRRQLRELFPAEPCQRA